METGAKGCPKMCWFYPRNTTGRALRVSLHIQGLSSCSPWYRAALEHHRKIRIPTVLKKCRSCHQKLRENGYFWPLDEYLNAQ